MPADIPDLRPARPKPSAIPKAVMMAVPLLVGFGLGLAVLGFAVLEFGEAKPDAKGGPGGLTSSIRIKPGARDRLRYLVSKGEVFFGVNKKPKAAGEAGTPEGADPAWAEEAAKAVAAAEEAVDEAMQDAEGGRDFGALTSGTRAGGSTGGGSPSGGGPAAARKPKDFPEGAGAAPKFNESAGKLNAKSTRKARTTRASLATSGGKGGKTDFLRTVPPRGPAVGRADAPPAEARSSGLDFLVGELPAPGEGEAGTAAAAASKPGEGSGAASGAGAGSGAGPGSDPNALPAQDPAAVFAEIESLLKKSADESEKAADEKTKAKVLAATGNLPQAHYHYERSKKAEKKSKEYSNQAQTLSATLTNKTPPPAE